MNTYITFIIPTIGRSSLIYSLQSLYNLIDPEWRAILIFDGIVQNIEINDSRIHVIEIEKKGINTSRNLAGEVRNIGMKYIFEHRLSPWIGFLDDDDTISPEYICNLKKETITYSVMDICIFRMAYPNKFILPAKIDKTIQRNRVGISFAIQTTLVSHLSFKNHPFEDYLFLKNAQTYGFHILLSSYVSYYVRCKSYEINELYPKYIIC